MSQNSQWDNLTFPDLAFPYNVTNAELSETPRLVTGSGNTVVTFGGKLNKRFGLNLISGTDTVLTSNNRIDRLWVYETMETPTPNVYLVASVFSVSGNKWNLYYCHLSTGVFWTQVPVYRQLNNSTQAHEAIQARGLLFVKGFPNNSGLGTDTLGTVILDGTGGTIATNPWGALGPTTPVALVGVKNNLATGISATAVSVVYTATSTFPATPFNFVIDYETLTATANNTGTKTLTVLRGSQGTIAVAHGAGVLILELPWTGSAHPVTVNLGWNYSYAYKSITGNVTNRVDIERNPDNLPSFTGPFLNLIPQITLHGLADTTNFPSILVLRTTDGGGTFFVLDTIANPGAGAFTYSDNKLASASGNADPIPDSQLNSVIIAPTLTSNSPPPSVTAPKVVGVDLPAPATPSAYYSGRVWYAIGNILFYSGNEEITIGVPEECFPAGTLGNFFRYQSPVLNVQATTNALYVICTDTVHAITGSTLDTFNSSPVIQSIGAPYNQPRAICRYGENIIFLSNDYRIISASGSSYLSLSDELGRELHNQVVSGALIDIKYWADLDKEYVIISCNQPISPDSSVTYVYDIKRSISTTPGKPHPNFWYAPWNMATTCVAVGRQQNLANENSLIFAQKRATGGGPYLGFYDTSGATNSDIDPVLGFVDIQTFIITNLFQTPSGNHINALRRPGVTTTVDYIQLDRTLFSNDTDPVVTWFIDDLWTTNETLPAPTGPIFRVDSIGYKTLLYAVNIACQRMAFSITKTNSNDPFELQMLTVTFAPDTVGG